MNMKERTLKYLIDNEDKGVSFKDIPVEKLIYPAIFMFYKNDSIEMAKC